jgi:hypothetical protein
MKRAIGFSVFTLAAFSMIQLFSPPVEAQSRSQIRDGVCFYTDANYMGEEFCFNGNENRSNVGGYNDKISSIRIIGNTEVTIYQDSNFGGSRQTITQNTPHLGNWNDRISSFQSISRRQSGRPIGSTTEPSDGVCFYTDANYRGERFCFASNESVQSVGDRYNDRISSIRVFGSAEVTVYTDSNFNGSRQTITQDTPRLGDWGDRITSFQITSRRQYGRPIGSTTEPSDGVCFYTDADYRGERLCFDSNASVQSVGDRYNDRISSVRIFGNAEVTVYADSNFNGSRQTFTQDTPRLGDWGDRITSFQTNPGRQYGRQYGPRRSGREPRNGACFFVDANYSGESFCMNAGDSQRELEGRFKDVISSIQVLGSAQAIVYDHVNFGGASRTFTRDASNLAGTFNDRISSIEVK